MNKQAKRPSAGKKREADGKRNETDSKNLSETEKKLGETVRKLSKTILKGMRSGNDLLVAVDDTFGMALVYAYGSFKTYNNLREFLFGDKEKLPQATGYCSFGVIRSIPCPCCLVWVNSKASKREAIPFFIHEISHLVDFILSNVQMDDKSGEARAHLMQRETKRVLEKMFGMKCHSVVVEKQVLYVLK